MKTRGRLTIVDLLQVVFALAFVAALYPVLSDALDGAVGIMTVGEVYLFRLLLPFMLLVLLSVVFVTTRQAKP